MLVEVLETIPITAALQPALMSAHTAVRSPNGRLYVSDELNHRIVILSSAGELQGVFGKGGSRPGELRYPRGLAILASPGGGYLLAVCDAWNHRIQFFTSEGEFVSAFGSIGDGRDDFNEPSIALPIGDGGLAILDRCNHRIRLCSLSGETIATYGAYTPSSFRRLLEDPMEILLSEKSASRFYKRGFSYPQGMALRADGTLVVADTNNRRISIFDPRREDWKIVELDRTESALPSCPEVVAVQPDGTIAAWVQGDTAIRLIEEALPYRMARFALPGFAGPMYRPALLPESRDTLLVVDGQGRRMMRCKLPISLWPDPASPPEDMTTNEEELWFEYFLGAEATGSIAPPVRSYLTILEKQWPVQRENLAEKENHYLEMAKEYFAILDKLESAGNEGRSSDELASSKSRQAVLIKQAEEAMAEKKRLLVQSTGLPAILLGALPEKFVRENLASEQESLRLTIEKELESRSEDFRKIFVRLRDCLSDFKKLDASQAVHDCVSLEIMHNNVKYFFAALKKFQPKENVDIIMRDIPSLPAPLQPFNNRYERLVEDFHFILSLLCMEWGLGDSARAILEYEANRLSPTSRIPYLFRAARARRENGGFADALMIFNMIEEGSLASLPDDQRRDFFTEKGHTLLSMSQPRQALSLYLKAGSHKTDSPLYLTVHTGIACEQLGRFDEAILFYRRALEKAMAEADAAGHRAAATGLIRALYLLGDFEKATESIASLPLEIREDAFFINVEGSRLQYQPEDDYCALPAIRELLVRYPDCAGLRLNLAIRLAMRGDAEEAMRVLEEEKKLSPEVHVAFVKGICQRISGKCGDAVRTFAEKDEFMAFPAAAVEFFIAACATGNRETVEYGERAFMSIARRDPCLNGFINVPFKQKGLIHEAMALLSREVSNAERALDLRWINSSTLRYAIADNINP